MCVIDGDACYIRYYICEFYVVKHVIYVVIDGDACYIRCYTCVLYTVIHVVYGVIHVCHRW